jgi:hypothetical protein
VRIERLLSEQNATVFGGWIVVVLLFELWFVVCGLVDGCWELGDGRIDQRSTAQRASFPKRRP